MASLENSASRSQNLPHTLAGFCDEMDEIFHQIAEIFHEIDEIRGNFHEIEVVPCFKRVSGLILRSRGMIPRPSGGAGSETALDHGYSVPRFAIEPPAARDTPRFLVTRRHRSLELTLHHFFPEVTNLFEVRSRISDIRGNAGTNFK